MTTCGLSGYKYGCRCDICRQANYIHVRKWRKANPEKDKQHAQKWRLNNLDKAAAKESRRRARQRSALHIPFTIEQLKQRLSMFAGCWMCSGKATAVDHVIALSRGGPHILANLRPACKSCNSSKGAKAL